MYIISLGSCTGLVKYYPNFANKEKGAQKALIFPLRHSQ